MESESKKGFDFGNKLREVNSGFIGVVVAIISYPVGYSRYALQGLVLTRDGTPQEWQWIDEIHLELVE